MLGEYKVKRCTRQCFALGRPLADGETYYSVIVITEGNYERRDYSAESWEGPPDDAIAHWKNRMPKSSDKKLVLAPREVLVDLLRQFCSPGEEKHPEQTKIAYLLALLLLRRRIVRESPGGSSQEPPESGEVLRLEVTYDGSEIEVPKSQVSQRESEALSEMLTELMYCDASDLEEGPSE